MTTAVSAPTAASTVPSPWFRSAPFDLLLVLAVPFLTWPLLMSAQEAWGAPLLNQLILLSATGHYFATFVRTYGDRELFARFKTRFLLAPALLLPTCIGLMATGHGGPLMLVTAGWAFWHWLAQAFGFARIYDRKRGSFRPLTAWLDKALVIAGFVGAITLHDGSLATFGKVFLDAGIPLPTGAQWAPVQTVVLGIMVVVGAAYLGNLAWTIARRQPWSWQKQFMHVTTIGYYWFAFAYVPNVLVAYVLYELFHDVQYFAITWLTCRQRVRRPGVAPWLARLFRPGAVAASGFVGAMLAFGAADYFARRLATDASGYQLALGVSLTAALLHYYYDGFIWKARESSLGNDLGIQGGLRATVVPGLRHAAAWSLFVLPLLGLLAFATPETRPRERAAALAALAPGDFLSQAELAFALATAGDLAAALVHYRAAVAAKPDYGRVRANYGAALELTGDLELAHEQYEHALACRDREDAHRQADVHLGVLLLLRGDRAAADRHFTAGAQLGGEPPIGRMLGLANAPATKPEHKQKLWSAVLQLDAEQPDARLALGNVMLQQRRFDVAANHFTVFLRRAPNYAPGLVGLATAQLELGELAAARSTLQRALQAEPGNAQALALQARLDGR
jgi:tetratricopeptide (TPR) repeat protein